MTDMPTEPTRVKRFLAGLNEFLAWWTLARRSALYDFVLKAALLFGGFGWGSGEDWAKVTAVAALVLSQTVTSEVTKRQVAALKSPRKIKG